MYLSSGLDGLAALGAYASAGLYSLFEGSAEGSAGWDVSSLSCGFLGEGSWGQRKELPVNVSSWG